MISFDDIILMYLWAPLIALLVFILFKLLSFFKW